MFSDFKSFSGGIESMAITEVFGGKSFSITATFIRGYWFAEFRTGKTQLSHTLCGTLLSLHPLICLCS